MRAGTRRRIFNVSQGTKCGVKAVPGVDPADGFAGTASKCFGPETEVCVKYQCPMGR